MKKAIYKITNNKNKKIYIGQSKNPLQRWKQHIYKKENYYSLIYQAIQKYGEENFTFEVIEWTEDYNHKEQYWIKKLRTLAPYGYNIAAGGDAPPYHKGEQHPSAIISQELADKIISQLQDWKIPRKTIVNNNKVTHSIIRHINEGNTWKKEDLTYPLRPKESEIDKKRVLYIQYLCCNSDISLNKIGALVGWGRSAAKMINLGNNHCNPNLRYPIRNNKEYNKKFLNQETCNGYLHFAE